MEMEVVGCDFNCMITVDVFLKVTFEQILDRDASFWKKSFQGRSLNKGGTFPKIMWKMGKLSDLS